ncbi:MAG: nitroreductase family protein [Candidatus Cryptobacteroides sp.]
MKRLITFAAALMMACVCFAQEQDSISEIVREVIMSRRSIRKYKPVPVGRDTLELILQSGINAPNGMNKQSWDIRVVDNPVLLESIKDAMAQANPDKKMARECFRGAPVVVFIANDTNYDCSPIDCGLLAGNMILSAWSMGVGSVCLGSPVRFIASPDNPSCEAIREVQDRLGFSEGYKMIICIGFGYADESPKAKPRDISKYKFVEL